MVFLGIYRAVYDYQPTSDEELEIKEGDLLYVLDKSSEDDWWKCRKKAPSEEEDEPEGLVPNNYVEEANPSHKARALYDYAQQTDEELSFKEDEDLDVYDESDPDWTLVGSNGQYGFAPAIYIEIAASGAAVTPSAASVAPQVRELTAPPPAMPPRPVVEDDAPLPGEADYVAPRHDAAASTPAAHIAGIIAQRTGGGAPAYSHDYEPASPALPQRPQYTPAEEEEEEAPQLPRRPPSQAFSSPSPPPASSRDQRRASQPTRSVDVSSPGPLSVSTSHNYELEEGMRSPGGYHLYNIHEMVTHMGKNKKMPTTLGINIGKGVIMISPEKSRDGPSKEWTAEKLAHYSIEGKHIFMELVRPSRSIDFHAGAKDTAQEIVMALGELAGAVRQEGLREVLAASAGTGAAGSKKGQMLYDFTAQGEDEVSVVTGDEVIILDDTKSEEWWMVRRVKTGKQGVVPSSYVEITGTVPHEVISGLNAARSTVEMNRQEEERLAREAVKKDKVGPGVQLPERHSSLGGDTRRTSMRGHDKRASSSKDKNKPNAAKVRTWTDRSGTFKVEAEFIGLKDGKIHLHKMNGVKIAVPVSKMAVDDLEYVERATGTSLDEDKPLSDIKRRSTLRAKESNEPKSKAGASVVGNDYDWFDFFLQCGVNPQICERYAGAFSRDQMGPEILPEVNEQLLRTLGLKEGDILRVMKFLNTKYNRGANGEGGESGGAGGLFSGPGGALRNNTRKGRPAPAVQSDDVIDENAFRAKTESPAPKESAADRKATPLAAAPARTTTNGFDDDAWDVKPSRAPASIDATPALVAAPIPEPPKPKINDDIALLSITSPALQPTPAPQPAPMQTPAPAQPAPVANQAIFDKIASLAPAAQPQQPTMTGYQQPQQTGFPQLQPQLTAMPRQRPAAPPQQPNGSGMLNMPPPPRATSAPGYPPQQMLGQQPIQPQLTGYQPQIAPPGHSLSELQHQQQQQQQQQYMQLQQQATAYQPAYNPQQPQPSFPTLQPQPTSFQPQSQFGQQQAQQFGLAAPQTYSLSAQPTGSPFADSSRPPFQPTPSALSTSFSAAQPTGFQQQPSFNLSQPTGYPGVSAAAPSLPPQQTGGVFGPSTPIAPLTPQRTGPAPPVRFGVQQPAKPLVSQPTGRANLAKATPQNPFGF